MIKGVNMVGFAMVSFGVTNALGSFFIGRAAKHIGRVSCLLIAALVNYTTIGVMLFRDLRADDNLFFYIIPGLWGLADAAWQTQINSLYGLLFRSNQEAAFSNFRLWESLGFAISYAYSTYFCTSTKLYLLVVYLSVGIVGYLAIETSEAKKKGGTGKLGLSRTLGVKFVGFILVGFILGFVYLCSS